MEQYFYLKEHFVMDYMVHNPTGHPPPPQQIFQKEGTIKILSLCAKQKA